MLPLYDFYRVYAAEITFSLVIVAVILLLWVIALQIRLSLLNRRYRAAMRGVDGMDFEKSLAQFHASVQQHTHQLTNLETRSAGIEKTMSSLAGKVAMVRFNPFDDTGGDQSFTIAWLDGQENGVVLSSLHNRTGTRVYAKPIVKGTSPHNLTEEEVKAIKTANSSAY